VRWTGSYVWPRRILTGKPREGACHPSGNMDGRHPGAEKRRCALLTSREILESIISGLPGEGPFALTDALSFARKSSFSGIGHAREKQGDFYLLFFDGDPAGAVLHDSKGTLFGNKAVYLIKGTEQFTLFTVKPEIVERLVLGCRIFDQEIFKRMTPVDIPEVKREREGGQGYFLSSSSIRGSLFQGNRSRSGRKARFSGMILPVQMGKYPSGSSTGNTNALFNPVILRQEYTSSSSMPASTINQSPLTSVRRPDVLFL